LPYLMQFIFESLKVHFNFKKKSRIKGLINKVKDNFNKAESRDAHFLSCF
jgi:hypothetical protein